MEHVTVGGLPFPAPEIGAKMPRMTTPRFLLDPKNHTRHYPDERSRDLMRATIAFFEAKGKAKLREDDLAQIGRAHV